MNHHYTCGEYCSLKLSVLSSLYTQSFSEAWATFRRYASSCIGNVHSLRNASPTFSFTRQYLLLIDSSIVVPTGISQSFVGGIELTGRTRPLQCTHPCVTFSPQVVFIHSLRRAQDFSILRGPTPFRLTFRTEEALNYLGLQSDSPQVELAVLAPVPSSSMQVTLQLGVFPRAQDNGGYPSARGRRWIHTHLTMVQTLMGEECYPQIGNTYQFSRHAISALN